jgi:hypothetical protein
LLRWKRRRIDCVVLSVCLCHQHDEPEHRQHQSPFDIPTSESDDGDYVLVVVTTAASFVYAGSIKRRFVRQLPPKPPGTAAEARSDCISPLQPTINYPSRQILRREGPSEPRQEADPGEYLSVLA